jgi:hypothetical protein
MSRLASLVVLLSALTVASACSQPPAKERGQAEGAIAAARAASAGFPEGVGAQSLAFLGAVTLASIVLGPVGAAAALRANLR